MDLKTYILTAFIAAVFTSWPIIGKWTGLPPVFTSLIVCLTGAMVSSIVCATTATTHVNNKFGVWTLVVIGLLNGYCVYLYTQLTSNPKVQTGPLMIMVAVFSVVLSLLLDTIINKATITPKQVLGSAFAIVAIVLISKK